MLGGKTIVANNNNNNKVAISTDIVSFNDTTIQQSQTDELVHCFTIQAHSFGCCVYLQQQMAFPSTDPRQCSGLSLKTRLTAIKVIVSANNKNPTFLCALNIPRRKTASRRPTQFAQEISGQNTMDCNLEGVTKKCACRRICSLMMMITLSWVPLIHPRKKETKLPAT